MSVMRIPPPFQSTRPIRGATRSRRVPPGRSTNFNPRAPYGARLGQQIVHAVYRDISIHAPHTGRDGSRPTGMWSSSYFNPRAPYGARPGWKGNAAASGRFQSTRPIRGATHTIRRIKPMEDISIHAPHTGRDSTRRSEGLKLRNFNPRAPYGARREIPISC